ncbi:hypothetical protein Q7P37_006242 [Cladosporium fusiforme]
MTTPCKNALKRERDSREPAAAPKKKHKRGDYSDILTILVGSDKKQFCVHKRRICNKSKFFKTSCKKERWLEGKTNTVALPDTEPDVFQLYLDWVYTGEIGIEFRWDYRNAIDSAYKSLFGLWQLGDFLDDPLLRYTAMRHLALDARGWPNPEIICEAWESTLAGSLPRVLIADKLIHRVCEDDFRKGIEDYPFELVVEVAIKLKKLRSVMKREEFVSRWVNHLKSNAVGDEQEDEDDGA